MTRQVRRLVGVYNASGTVWGELSYLVGSRLGRTHCGLCDITHGTVRERPEWRRCRDELPVAFETVHLDDRPAGLVALTDGRTPCVVAELDDDAVVLLGPAELDACAGSPRALVDAVVAAAARADLVL